MNISVGKISSYFLYALGELFLLVIGVLIALQIGVKTKSGP